LSATSARAARLERDAAKALGSERVKRWGRKISAPDVKAVPLPNGVVLGAECKSRKRLPSVVVAALKQAAKYFPGAVALAVVRQKGGRAIACLDLDAFARLVGLDVAALPAPTKTKRPSKQLELGVV